MELTIREILMPVKYRQLLLPTLLLVIATTSTVALVSARNGLRDESSTKERPISAQVAEQINNPAAAGKMKYVRAGVLRPQLATAFRTLGDRLEKPGKERLMVSGTLRRQSEESQPFLLAWEYPGRLRLEVQAGVERRVHLFDGASNRPASGNPDGQTEYLLETLFYDSAEHFFTAQTEGRATRFLGPRFHLSGSDESAPDNSAYDLFEIAEQVHIGRVEREQTKLYAFNSETHLLELIRYEVERDGATVQVEVRFSGWHEVQGQQMPSRIVRLENNRPVATIEIESAALGPKTADELFN